MHSAFNGLNNVPRQGVPKKLKQAHRGHVNLKVSQFFGRNSLNIKVPFSHWWPHFKIDDITETKEFIKITTTILKKVIYI